MSDLPNLLLASLQPATRKQAEQALIAFSNEPNSLSILLAFVLEGSQDKGARLAGATLFKNTIKRRWFEDQDEPPILASEKSNIRSSLLPAMISLTSTASSQATKPLLAQINTCVSLIAQSDFPTSWPDLISQLASLLTPTDVLTNNSVLETAHSIFGNWRSAIRSDELYTVINLVLEQFLPQFMALFRATAEHLLSPAQAQNADERVAKSMDLLTVLFYDLVCQDLPPAIEDAHVEFFASPSGFFPRLLGWSPPNLLRSADDDETEASLPSKVKTNILELLELYIKRYAELFQLTNGVDAYVMSVWTMLSSSSGTSTSTPNPSPFTNPSTFPISDDALISQSLRFLATSIRSNLFTSLFNSPTTIVRIVQDVLIPNLLLRTNEVEQFEDDPMEWVRTDLFALSSGGGGGAIASSSLSEGSTRRQAAAEVLRAFVSVNLENTTGIVSEWVGKGLEIYKSNPKGSSGGAGGGGRVENWKVKDCAIYLMSAIAIRGSTSSQGVTSTNALINIIDFFASHVYQDLESTDVAHPLLQVDAIRFLYSFRNQLTKDQLLSVLPLLIRHVTSPNYVTSTYAAITIERVLFIKQGGRLLFTQSDIHDQATAILVSLFNKIESYGSTAEKISENDYLMKCVMRVVITARQSLSPVYEAILGKLISILGIMSKNPSNPNFAQYTFESISALIRFIVAGKPDSLTSFESSLFGPFTYILQQDVEEYVPYVFQLLAQLLELRPATPGTPIPETYTSLLPVLTTPALWQQKGSIPGLVRLLKSFLAKDAVAMSNAKQLDPIAGVLVQRLIPSKLNDVWGFELLEGFVTCVPTPNLATYYRPLIIALLTRMNNNRTDRFAYSLARFFCYVSALEKPNDTTFNPDYTIQVLEGIQPGIWGMLLDQVVLPEVPKAPPRDRRLVVVGLTRILTKSRLMMQSSLIENWPQSFTTLVKLFSDPQLLKSSSTSSPEESDLAVTQIDFEEQSSGYQAAYSKLSASETSTFDPVAYVADPRAYLIEGLNRLNGETPGFRDILARCDAGVCGPFLEEGRKFGLEL